MAGLGKDAADRRVSHATKRVKRYVDSVPHSAPQLDSDGCVGANRHLKCPSAQFSMLRCCK